LNLARFLWRPSTKRAAAAAGHFGRCRAAFCRPQTAVFATAAAPPRHLVPPPPTPPLSTPTHRSRFTFVTVGFRCFFPIPFPTPVRRPIVACPSVVVTGFVTGRRAFSLSIFFYYHPRNASHVAFAVARSLRSRSSHPYSLTHTHTHTHSLAHSQNTRKLARAALAWLDLSIFHAPASPYLVGRTVHVSASTDRQPLASDRRRKSLFGFSSSVALRTRHNHEHLSGDKSDLRAVLRRYGRGISHHIQR